MKTRQFGLAASLAALANCVPAVAQDHAVVYGVVDTFITRIAADGAPAVSRMDASGLFASRLGVRGGEDLGDGLKASYTLEMGINSDDGSGADGNRLFNRQSWVGLSNKWGEVRLGRQNTPQFTMNGKFDAFGGTTQASGWNNFAGAALRVDNAVGVYTADMEGFKAQALFARGAVGGGPLLPEVAGNRNLHLALEYERGPWYAGLNYEGVNNTALAYQVRRSAASLSYRFDQHWKLFGAMNRERSSDRTIDSNLYSVSLLYSLTGPASLAVGYAGLRDHVSGKGHGGAGQASLLFRYYFSKRTTLYAGYADLRQRGQRSNFVLAGAAVVQPAARIAAVPGGGITGWQLGVAHWF
jgi:predicted porin